MTTYAAIPTMYEGVQFRSRLEARYAALFNLMDLRWSYEPIELAGYIPDFLVENPYTGGRREVSMLVEIKPAARFPDLTEACAKIERSGWSGPAIAFGREPLVCLSAWEAEEDVFSHPTGDPDLGSEGFYIVAKHRQWWWGGGINLFGFVGQPELASAWAEAGNLTQYKSPRKR